MFLRGWCQVVHGGSNKRIGWEQFLPILFSVSTDRTTLWPPSPLWGMPENHVGAFGLVTQLHMQSSIIMLGSTWNRDVTTVRQCTTQKPYMGNLE